MFGEAPDPDEPRPEPTDDRERALLDLPFGLHHVADATPLRPDWVVARPILAGVCGSDAKLLLGDFGEGDIDNPMAAFSSLPFVPGHEVVAEVVGLGPGATGIEPGQRVVLNPWLTCLPRGVDPVCPACRSGDLSLCWSFTDPGIGPGVHIGVATGAPGAWAEGFSAHPSMLFPVPTAVSDEAAVLADPFAVSLHAILHHPPPPDGRVIVYGAGALGLTTLAALEALYPGIEVAVVARFPAQADAARRFGAALVVDHEPRTALVEQLADWSGGVLHAALDGLPMAHPGRVDVVYDTVASPGTLEVGARLLAARGTLVTTGVATPGRWEWTPVYFKELTIAGSNAFGVEELEGERRHAIDHYLRLVLEGRIDVASLVTHRFPLDDWWGAVLSLGDPAASGVLKAAFVPSPGRPSPPR